MSAALWTEPSEAPPRASLSPGRPTTRFRGAKRQEAALRPDLAAAEPCRSAVDASERLGRRTADAHETGEAAVPFETAPTVITVKRFVCPFCHRGHSKRPDAEAHIARCFSNPVLRGCKSCACLEIHEPEPEVGLSGGEFCMADSIDLSAGRRTGCPLWEPKGGAS